MPRFARIVFPEIPHHIIQRGNNQQAVFLNGENQSLYLRYLREESQKCRLTITSYCLMTNHIHLVVTPADSVGLFKGIGQTNLRYTQYFNKRYGRIGHLWQGRFKSYPMDGVHFVNAIRYGELNPVRAGIVDCASDYPWSSAAAHTGFPDQTGLLDLDWWRSFYDPGEWLQILKEKIPDEVERNIRNHWKTGLPLGSEEFIRKLESQTNRRLRPPQMGRPRKDSGEVKK